MKKGGVIPSTSGAPTTKRRRSDGNSPPQPVIPAPESVPIRWRAAVDRPTLGGASSDWELPDVGTTDIHAVTTWEAANAAASASRNQAKVEELPAQKQQQQQHTKTPPADEIATGGSHHHDAMSMMSASQSHALPSLAGTSVSSATTGSASKSLSTTNTHSSQTTASSGTGGVPSIGGVAQPMPAQPSAVYHPPPAAAPLPPVVPAAPDPPQVPSNAVPKAILYQFYGKKPRRKQLANEDYLSWNDGGKPHELKFTAIFQCPLTGECFPAGRHGDQRFYSVQKTLNNEGKDVEVIWYTKKAFAEHGAAARCYDCMQYRDALLQGGDAVQQLGLLGNDPPYASSFAPALPPLPADIVRKIEQNRQRLLS